MLTSLLIFFAAILAGNELREQLGVGCHAGQQRDLPDHRRKDPEAGGRHQRPLTHVQLRNVHLLRTVRVSGDYPLPPLFADVCALQGKQ